MPPPSWNTPSRSGRLPPWARPSSEARCLSHPPAPYSMDAESHPSVAQAPTVPSLESTAESLKQGCFRRPPTVRSSSKIRTHSATPARRPADLPSSAGSSTAWDISGRYMKVMRTGPTGIPGHIQTKHPDFNKCTPSPLMLYYYDETAPNNVLLHNDVRGEHPFRTTKQQFKKFLTCQSSQDEEYPITAEEYSVIMPSKTATELSDDSTTDRSSDASSSQESSNEPKPKQGCCGMDRQISAPSGTSSESCTRSSTATTSVTTSQMSRRSLGVSRRESASRVSRMSASNNRSMQSQSTFRSSSTGPQKVGCCGQTRAQPTQATRGRSTGTSTEFGDSVSHGVSKFSKRPPVQYIPAQKSISEHVHAYSNAPLSNTTVTIEPASLQTYPMQTYSRGSVQPTMSHAAAHGAAREHGLPCPYCQGSGVAYSEKKRPYKCFCIRAESSAQSISTSSSSAQPEQQVQPRAATYDRRSTAKSTVHTGQILAPPKPETLAYSAPATVSSYAAYSQSSTAVKPKPGCCGAKNDFSVGSSSSSSSSGSCSCTQCAEETRVLPATSSTLQTSGTSASRDTRAAPKSASRVASMQRSRSQTRNASGAFTDFATHVSSTSVHHYHETQQPEKERDFGYHIRRMFFNVEDAAESNEFKMCPTYSVSYKNYPEICYDVVNPSNYRDFFRVRQPPL